MKHRIRIMSAVLSAVLLFAFVGFGKSDEMTMLRGELVSVTPASHTIVVKDSKGDKVEFTYDNDTKITGANDTIEGLAGKAGTSVTVYYKEESGKKVATSIEVHSMPAY